MAKLFYLVKDPKKIDKGMTKLKETIDQMGKEKHKIAKKKRPNNVVILTRSRRVYAVLKFNRRSDPRGQRSYGHSEREGGRRCGEKNTQTIL